jgi:alpha-ketoglutarate-dependent taurine dioxygenase
MGRPRKEINESLLFHLIKNGAPIAYAARYLSVHRDTLYVNYADVIEEGRKAHYQAWQKVIVPYLEELARKRRAKQEAKRAKRKYRPRGLHPSFWQP